MISFLSEALSELGIKLTLHRGENVMSGTGVVIPYRNMQKSDGEVTHYGTSRSEPQKYYIYAESRFLKNAVRGDTVSDGKNEYYILWTDEYRSRYGNYVRAAVRACRKNK